VSDCRGQRSRTAPHVILLASSNNRFVLNPFPARGRCEFEVAESGTCAGNIWETNIFTGR